MHILSYLKNQFQNSTSNIIKERKRSLYMARIVFNEDMNFTIRKTWVATVKKTRVLVPKEIRKDTTGRKHLTNDINSGEMYNVGLLLTEPDSNEWVWSTWRSEHTVKFRGYITKNNYITIPAEVRKEYEIQDGDKIQIAVTQRIFEQETDKPYQSHVPTWMNI